MSKTTADPAVFLDRDNTLIEDPGYICDPNQVRLLPGAAAALRRLRQAGYLLVVATNQSGVARGLFTEDDLQAVHERLRELLRAEDADVDAIYYCPYLSGPEAVNDTYRRDSDLRKPRPGMLLLAAQELNLDLTRSWMVGDSERDMEAGRAAGCRTILITRDSAPDGEATLGNTQPDYVAADFAEATERIIAMAEALSEQEPSPDRDPSEADRHPSPWAVPSSSPTTPSTHDQAPVGSKPVASANSPPSPTPPAANGASVEMLNQIAEELRLLRRERQYVDFSIAKLAGAIAQAFAICSVGWALYRWLESMPGPDPEAATSATIWLLAGIAFQLITLTCLAAAHKR